jgi:hypothetical protein
VFEALLEQFNQRVLDLARVDSTPSEWKEALAVLTKKVSHPTEFKQFREIQLLALLKKLYLKLLCNKAEKQMVPYTFPIMGGIKGMSAQILQMTVTLLFQRLTAHAAHPVYHRMR